MIGELHAVSATRLYAYAKEVRAEPPVLEGALHESDDCPLLTIATTLVGAAGAPAGVAATTEGAPKPAAVSALTRKK